LRGIARTADILQRYAAAFAEDHERAAVDFYTDDVLLRIPGRHPCAGEFRGRGPVLAALNALTSATDGTFGAREVKDAAFMPSAAMVHVLMGAARQGRTAEWERVILYRLAGERIQEITFFDFDTRPLERLFGG
jgi:ketosteroid isomerase-like protein